MDEISRALNLGIGVDIVTIKRFESLVPDEDQTFLDNIFTAQELSYCFSKGTPAEHLAARYAGKEAVIKALTSVKKVSVNYRDIEILNNNYGVPEVRFNKKGLEKLKTYLSLSHCEDKALAFVIIEVLDHE
jgi:holo-[acyl-carrier protein] synthase